MLGRPVVSGLLARGYRVRLFTRNVDKSRSLFGDHVTLVVGSVVDPGRLEKALSGCRAVHISLPQESERTVAQQVVNLSSVGTLEQITYVSATSASEENR